MRYIFIIGLFLTGCANPKKLHKMMDKLPEATAKECGQRYPVIEKSDTVTYIDSADYKLYQAENTILLIRLDSMLQAGCDTLYIDRIKEIIKNRPARVETKYIIKTQESTAKLQAAKDSLGAIIAAQNKSLIKCDTRLKDSKETARKRLAQRNWWFIMFVIMTIFAFRRQILKLII